MQRLINRVDHLDNILPYDGDLTSRDIQNKRMTRHTGYDDEIIEYNQYLTNEVTHPIELNDIITNQENLILEHDWELKQKLDLLKKAATLFCKHAQINNGHRFIKTNQINHIISTQISTAIQWVNEIHEEMRLLHTQRNKLTLLDKEITDSTQDMTTKLKSLTNLDWSPDMDSIIGTQTLAFSTKH